MSKIMTMWWDTSSEFGSQSSLLNARSYGTSDDSSEQAVVSMHVSQEAQAELHQFTRPSP